ncbi:MAG: AAA family ATPase, partial [Clostridiales Family XIII bacterium]|nr:AAA family ATPase [Clostridiales Family XIII bacterium]
MKRLPLGIQTFEKIIDGDYLYVDKTEVINRLLTATGNVVFLSRPRRFGKSLLCSTLRSVFEGKRELFKGLANDDLDLEWTEYPVIHIDFNAGDFMNGKTELLSRISLSLKKSADKYGVTVPEDVPSSQFENLIIALSRKFDQKVVVIIDEYDKPLLGTIDAPAIHKELRGMLKGFFGVLKTADEYLKFSFITGVTKFSKVSIFSDLNQLDDISLKPEYADICGIT